MTTAARTAATPFSGTFLVNLDHLVKLDHLDHLVKLDHLDHLVNLNLDPGNLDLLQTTVYCVPSVNTKSYDERSLILQHAGTHFHTLENTSTRYKRRLTQSRLGFTRLSRFSPTSLSSIFPFVLSFNLHCPPYLAAASPFLMQVTRTSCRSRWGRFRVSNFSV